MKINALALSLGTLLALGASLQASTTYDYSFGGVGGDLHSNIHTFSPTGASGPSITASGYEVDSSWLFGSYITPVDLYRKGSGGDENGLGLTNDPSHENEITSGSFIMLDLGNFDDLVLTSLKLSTESTTGNDKFEIWGSNSAPSFFYSIPTSGLITGKGQGFQNVSSLDGDRYIFVSAQSGNVLLGGLSATTVTPEPASAALVGLALAGAGMLFRRRFQS
jgi:hypothetical protein